MMAWNSQEQGLVPAPPASSRSPAKRAAARPKAAARPSAAVALALLLAATGCASLKENFAVSNRRALRDLLVTGAMPAQVLVGAGVDSYEYADARPWLGVPAAPITFAFSAFKHVMTSAVYTVDLAFYPLYCWFGAEPIEIYDTGQFPFGQPASLHASGRRMARDATVLTTFPLAAPLAAGNDTWRYIRSHPVKGAFAAPLVFTLDAVKHVLYGVCYTVDLAAYPLYFPFAADPVRIYEWESYPFDATAACNASANRFGQSFETFLTFPVMMWFHTYRAWKPEFDRQPVLMSIAAPFYFPVVGLYHAHLGIVSAVDSLVLYPFYFLDGWKPFDLYHPANLRLNPLKARTVDHLSAAVFLSTLGAGEIVLGFLLFSAETGSDLSDLERTTLGYYLILHGQMMMEAGGRQASQGLTLADLARTLLTNYRTRTAQELLQLAVADRPEQAAAPGAYDLGDLKDRAPDAVNERLGKPIQEAGKEKSETKRKFAKEQAEQDVKTWSNIVVRVAEMLARADEYLDRELAADIRAKILAETGALTIAPGDVGEFGGAPGMPERVRVINGLLGVYHFPDDTAGQDKLIEDLERILKSDLQDAAWFTRCRREMRLIRRNTYTRTGTYNVLRSLMSEGFLWLYQTIKK